ncbi:LLM class flavin-dependent oxidoreductase [Hydrogenophaga sp. OTU3427]|uniref:LLM class flavin-dependent oxidoreductase n=1 Tax=Hydrogenophaga sp. OTU3427 TaxID=3043856 RepID=UPI00313E2026
MSLEFIGFIGTSEQSESLSPRGPLVDNAFIKASIRAQEYGGFDKALIAVNSASPDALALGAYAAGVSDTLGLLIAQRPGFTSPTLAARQLATLDQLSGGRVAVNVITGGDGGDLQKDGDFLPHDERYERTDEYLDVAKKVWTSDGPFDHSGKHYRVERNHTAVRPLQKPHIPIYFSGASDAAVRVAAKHADVYMMWGEPLEQVRARIAAVRAEAAKLGRADQIRFSLSLRPIVADTEAEAWARADRILERTRANYPSSDFLKRRGANINVGSDRLVDIASKARVHDKRLWTEIAGVTAAAGNSTGLVGTPEQVAESVLDYYKAGISTFLFRGFDPLQDAVAYGQHLLPLVRRQVAELERGAQRRAA